MGTPKVTLIIFSLSLNFAIAQESGTYPANFTEESIQTFFEKLEFEDIDVKDSTIFRCQSIARPNGHLDPPMCFGNALLPIEANPIVRAITKATNNLQIKPAVAHGKRVQVLFPFSLLVTNLDGETHYRLVSNHLGNASEFGMAYISPQRIIPLKFGLFRNTNTFRCHTGDYRGFQIDAVISKVSISEFGIPEHANIDIVEDPRCSESLERQFLDKEFIPAFNNNGPISATYTELILIKTKGR